MRVMASPVCARAARTRALVTLLLRHKRTVIRLSEGRAYTRLYASGERKCKREAV